jgi:hypothetical protein
MRSWGHADRPVLPSGAPAFDREPGGSWPVTGPVLAGPARPCRSGGRKASGWGGSWQRPGVAAGADVTQQVIAGWHVMSHGCRSEGLQAL